MERSELEIIKELMAELEAKMEPSKDDFEERLGRKKPEVAVMKIEGDIPDDAAEEASESPEFEKKEEMMGDSENMEGMDEEEMSPEAKLKSRLMKLRS